MISQETALDRLCELIPVGATVHTILRHVSRSGMSRAISVIYTDSSGETHDLDWLIHAAGIARFNNRHGGLTMGGCGMDMGYALIYRLGRSLYPNGAPCTGHPYTERRANGRKVLGCMSNDHMNGQSTYRRGKRHSDGGYVFKQSWL